MGSLLKLINRPRNCNVRLWLVVLAVGLLGLGTLTAFAAQTTKAQQPAVDHVSQNSEHLERVSPSFNEFLAPPMTNGLTLKVMMVLLQLSLVLAAAKLLGALAEKLSIPGVLGELAAGMILGPFALGSLIHVPIHGMWVALFPKPIFDTVLNRPEWPISYELWLVAQLGSVVLLFLAGLHTNLQQFFKYIGPATVCAIGGVVAPFFLGAFATQWFSESVLGRYVIWYAPEALFIGAIMVATSVGISARVLSDIHQLDTPEGVTILGGAVIDDVLGILVLAIVAAIAQAKSAGQAVEVGEILVITAKAIGFWIGLTAIGLALANRIENLFQRVHYAGARLGLALALCLLCAGVAELFGLAFIIGAYSIGLALSKTRMAHHLMEDLTPVNDFVVPIFFAVMGMLVDYAAMGTALLFGTVICGLAIISKVLGCGLPALLVGFNKRGAFRVGIGMLPRGEVALIMAGVGLVGGYISQELFGVAILMTLVTTVMAPLILVPAFRGGSGRRGAEEEVARPKAKQKIFAITMPEGVTHLFVQMLLTAAGEAGYKINFDQAESGMYLLQKDDLLLNLVTEDGNIRIDTAPENYEQVSRIISEAEKRILQAVKQVHPHLQTAK